MTDDEKMKKADANTVAGQMREFSKAVRNVGVSVAQSAQVLGAAFKKMTAGGIWHRPVFCKRCATQAVAPKGAPMPPLIGLPHSPSCTVELTRACDEAVKAKVVVVEKGGPKIKGTHYDTVIVDDLDDPANSKGAVDREMMFRDFSLVDPPCMMCHIQTGGGWMGARPTQHSPSCNKPLVDATDEAVKR